MPSNQSSMSGELSEEKPTTVYAASMEKEEKVTSVITPILEKYHHIKDLQKEEIVRLVKAYIVAIVIAISTIGLQYLLNTVLGSTSSFLLAFAAITLSSWYGGLQGGIITTILVSVGIDYFLLYPHAVNTSKQLAMLLQVTIVIAEGILISIVIEKCKYTKEVRAYMQREKEYITMIIKQKELQVKAQEEIKARDEFLSIASHELKTPLTSMLLKLQTALHNIRNVSLAKFSVEHLMKMLESAEQQTIRLSKMINDLLNISLITTGRIDLHCEEVDLVTIVKETADRFSEKLAEEHYILHIHTPERLVGNWDKIRIEQVVINLLSNAMKYGEQKDITVSVTASDENAILTVADNGIGIETENQKRIFALFERGVSPKDYKGLGVGLYITNQIVLAHKGTISLQSKLHHGSIFTVTLPLKSTHSRLSIPPCVLVEDTGIRDQTTY